MNGPGREESTDSLSAADYAFVCELLRRDIGYELGPDRQYLVMNRLASVAAERELPGVVPLIERLRLTGERQLRDSIVESMTINETSFFRGGQKLFEGLVDTVLPRLIRSRAARRIKIWSGACSTGQEPYSIAMMLEDRSSQSSGCHVDILATDVSDRALDQARSGTYSQFEIQRGLPESSLRKHFAKCEDQWQIAPGMRRRVNFQKHNLLDSFLTLSPPWDIVFLRNVLIYFDMAGRQALLQRVRQVIAADGYLVLGETESILGTTDQFQLTDMRDFYSPTPV